MKIHEIRTQHTPAEVIERARSFFGLASSPYAAFSEEVGEGYLKLFMEVGEIVIGCVPEDGVTLVRGSASRGEQMLTQFLTTLAPPLEARQELLDPEIAEGGAALELGDVQGHCEAWLWEWLPPGR